jgi:hypothetical protein
MTIVHQFIEFIAFGVWLASIAVLVWLTSAAIGG